MESQTTGERLKILIERYLKTTQVDFARRTGIPEQSVSAYISNIRSLGNRAIVKVCSTFPEVNSEYLRSGELPVLIDPTLKEVNLKEQVTRLEKIIEALSEQVDILSKQIQNASEKEILLLKLLNKNS